MSSTLASLNRFQTPRSSLGNQLQVHRSSDAHNPHNPFDPDAKRHRPNIRDDEEYRQKEDRARVFSKHFPPRKSHDDTILDGPDPEHPRQREESVIEVHDLTREGSQPETGNEALSVASSGKHHATAGLQEFRNAKPGKVQSRRTRKSRNQPDGHSPARQHLSPDVIHVPTSPDVLCQDDLPPARVVSDIPPYKPRHLAGTKRPRNTASSESEDELANTFAVDTASGKKSTNFSGVSASKRVQRGDIQRSSFTPRLKARAQTMPQVTISRAVSGHFIYSKAGQTDGPLRLRLRSEGFADVIHDIDGSPRSLAWLEIHHTKILSVWHGATHSQIVIIKRSATSAAPSQLALEFDSCEDAVKVVSWLPRTTCEEKEVTHLQRVLETSYHNAERHGGSTHREMAFVSSPRAVGQETPRGTAAHNVGSRLGPSQRTPKLKDKMKGLPMDASITLLTTNDTPAPCERRTDDMPDPRERTPNEAPAPRERSMVTRQRQRQPPSALVREPSPLLPWTALNPDWDKDWRMTLEFPVNARNRASVDKDDVIRLDEGEFLNDNLINFYLRYLQVDLELNRPDILQKVHFFNTYLFPTIKSGAGSINYKGVEKWTAKVDLFSYKYIVVPINENLHWYLAIIYNAPKLLPDSGTSNQTAFIDLDAPSPGNPEFPETISLDDGPAKSTGIGHPSESMDFTFGSPLGKPPAKGKHEASASGTQKSIEDPKIITLDSLGNPRPLTCKTLKSYLTMEARHKKNVELLKLPTGMTAKHIPTQDNHCDCGAFLLGYVEEFLKDPDEAIRRLLQKEDLGWDVDASRIRDKVRSLIIQHQKVYQDGEESRREERRKQRRPGRMAGFSSQSSPREAPPQGSAMLASRQAATSPLTNGIKTPTMTSPPRQVFSAPAEEKSRSYSEEQKPPSASPSMGPEPVFIRLLEEDPSLESKTALSGEGIHSARSSLEEASQIPVDLTTEGPSHVTQGANSQRPEPAFVQHLSSSSPSDSTLEVSGTKRPRSESPEVSLVQVRSARPRETNLAQRRRILTDEEVLPSTEGGKPSARGPQYDGVDRFQFMGQY